LVFLSLKHSSGEPLQEVLTPWVLSCGTASYAAELARESELQRIPSGHSIALTNGRTFLPACYQFLEKTIGIEKRLEFYVIFIQNRPTQSLIKGLYE
jgi:hypothetical protein